MTQRFVSYSSKNRPFVRALAEVQGWTAAETFIDERSLRVGEVFPRRIEEAIDGCEQFHLVWSRSAAESAWVGRELARALGRWPEPPSGFLFVYRIDDHPLPESVAGWAHAVDVRDLLPRADKRISMHRLPTSDACLFGREQELEDLDLAWGKAGANAVVLVAQGGVGKTALVHAWAADLGSAGWPGAARAFAWSFYRQGAGEGRQASSDLFIDTALRWFGDEDPTAGDPWAKGERLAGLVRQEPTLLVLDGMEPLQHPPGPSAGEVKDPALSVLVKELAAHMDGLLVITTRVRVRDLDGWEGTVRQADLGRLADDAGRHLLRSRGVRGTDTELEQASREMAGHALALRLLGSYLAERYPGDPDIRKRDTLGPLTGAEDGGGHARRVMDAYAWWLGEGSPEVALLRVVGLFDRPASKAELAAVLREPAIEGVTGALLGAGERGRARTVAHLQKLGLLAPAEDPDDGGLDAHPLVREHFGEALRAAHPGGWGEAHGRLYEHLCGAAPDLPDTVEATEPLFRAVGHGAAAGRHQEALDDVYYRRIDRGGQGFAVKKLGAFSADLAALSHLFADPWRDPARGIAADAQSFVLGQAGFRLRALGRLKEAVEPMEAGLERCAAQSDWENAAIVAGNLSELHLTLGQLDRAEERAREAVGHADRSGDWAPRMGQRTTVADALHQRGQLDEALALFEEGERVQIEQQPEYPVLYSLGGYRYADLLLTIGRPDEALRRAAQTLPWMEEQGWLLDIALDKLTHGRARLALAERSGGPVDAAASDAMDQAVSGLHRAARQEYLPRGLLARAALSRHRAAPGDAARARHDLDEARTIATRGSMRLHLADLHLEDARLALSLGDRTAAATHAAEARQLVAAMGYHRRDPELTALAAALDTPA